ncbi:MAG: hypothetical protein AAF615_05350 [Pseudomonadota bacterium]
MTSRNLNVLAFAAALAATSAWPVLAQARPDTRNYSCQGAQAFVASQGIVTMSTGTHTFQRFAANPQNCPPLQRRMRAAYVPTTDNAQCKLQTCGRQRTSTR